MSAATSNVVHITQPALTFAAALVEAQRYARAVGKGSTNDFHRYKYASAEAIIEEAREALAHAGIAVFPLSWRIERQITTVDVRDGKPVPLWVLDVTYRVQHESGESFEATTSTSIIPEKGRPHDKAEAAALTYSLGYYLRGLLLLPRVEPGSQVDERRDDREPKRQAAPRAEAPRETGEVRPEHEEAASSARANMAKVATYSGMIALIARIERSKLLGPCKGAVLGEAKAKAKTLEPRANGDDSDDYDQRLSGGADEGP